MSLLIDGYNLLHASGVLARGVGPGTLERSRTALLNFLVASLSPEETARAIIVFDGGQSATGRVRRIEHSGLRVQFSAGKADADDLIEELIRADSAPRRLVVVSSDHRVQRAALRRRARAIDSDKWMAELRRARSERRDAGQTTPAKASEGLSEVEVRFWLERFGIDESTALREATPPSTERVPAADRPESDARAEIQSALPNAPDRLTQSASPVAPQCHVPRKERRPSKRSNRLPNADLKGRGGENPFPPGYGDDLIENQE